MTGKEEIDNGEAADNKRRKLVMQDATVNQDHLWDSGVHIHRPVAEQPAIPSECGKKAMIAQPRGLSARPTTFLGRRCEWSEKEESCGNSSTGDWRFDSCRANR